MGPADAALGGLGNQPPEQGRGRGGPGLIVSSFLLGQNSNVLTVLTICAVCRVPSPVDVSTIFESDGCTVVR